MMGLSLRKIGRGLRRAGRGIVKAPVKLAKSAARKFVPGRDARKAKMVKALNAKLVKEHANFLHMKDLRRGVKRPHGLYVAASKPWARAQISKAGLPTSLSDTGGGGDDILGAAFIGTWWNPASWFSRKAKYVLVNTEGQRLAEMSETEYQAFKGSQEAMALRDQQQQEAEGAPTPEEAAQQLQEEAGPPPEMPPEMPAADEAGDEIMTMGKLYRSIKDPFEGIDGWAEEQMYNPEELAFILGNDENQIPNPEELAFIYGDEGDEVQQIYHPEEAAFIFGTDFSPTTAHASPNMDHLAFIWGAEPSHGERYDRAIEAAGDDRIGRLSRRRAVSGAFVGGRRRRKKHHHHTREHEAQRASALDQMITRQLPSKVVSRKLVCHWAIKAAHAMGKGKDEARRLAKWKKRQIEAAGATLSKSKSETAGCF